MCIVVYKKIGKELPSRDILKNCFVNNPDGAGFMYNHKNKVIIEKGFMTWEAFDVALANVEKSVDVRKTAMVLHFRITTQGGINQECTHPFPLSDNMDDLKLLRTTRNIGIAHNGIISLTSTYSKVNYSDTMKFITDYLSLIITNKDYYKSDKTLKLIKRLCGSKLAILDYTGHCELIGDFVEDNGFYYSNSSYQQSKIKVAKTTTPYSFDDYDYWELFYNYKTDEYEFDSKCPYIVDGDTSYCDWCRDYGICWSKNKTKQTTEYAPLMHDGEELTPTKETFYDDYGLFHQIYYDENDRMYDVVLDDEGIIDIICLDNDEESEVK